jgi:hypothetical protein
MYKSTEPFNFPELPDEAVIAINDFLEEFYRRFQNHYFAQMHRYDRRRRASGSQSDPTPLSESDPPF